MGCNCRWTETVLALVILVVTIWPGILGASATRWVVIIAAALFLIHAWKCDNCGTCMPETKSGKKKRK